MNLVDWASQKPASEVPKVCPGCGHDFHSNGNCLAIGPGRCPCGQNVAVSLDISEPEPPFDETLAEKLERLEAENARLAALAVQNAKRAEDAEHGWQEVLLKHGRPEQRSDAARWDSALDMLEQILAELRRSNSTAREGAVSSVQVEETAKGPRVTVKIYAGSVAPVEEAIEDFGRGIRLAQEGQMRNWEATVDSLAEAQSA